MWAEIKVWLDASDKPLKSGDRVKLSYKNSEIPCRIVFLDRQLLLPGEQAAARCALEAPLNAKPGEQCLILTYSKGKQIGECSVERIHLPEPGLGEKQQLKVKQIEDRLLTNRYQPVLWSLIAKDLFFFNPAEGEQLREYLEAKGTIVPVSEDLYFHRDAIESAKDLIREYIENNGSITSAEARDLLGSSRKFVIPLLEYFDAQGLTIRKGNRRVLA